MLQILGKTLRLSASVTAFSMALPVLAQQPGQGQSWKLLLSSQLSDEKRCDLEATIFVREIPSPEGVLYSGRVRCIDGREFDFSQTKAHLKFELRACEPAAC